MFSPFSFYFPFQLVDGGAWGTWGEWRYCPEGYSGANVMQEPPQGVRQQRNKMVSHISVWYCLRHICLQINFLEQAYLT